MLGAYRSRSIFKIFLEVYLFCYLVFQGVAKNFFEKGHKSFKNFNQIQYSLKLLSNSFNFKTYFSLS